MIDQAKQLQELLKNVFDDKILEMLKNIQKLLEQNNNKTQIQQQLKNMQPNTKTLARDVERIKELYAKLQLKAEVNEFIEKLKDLAQDQKKLSEETTKQDDTKKDPKDANKLETAIKEAAAKLEAAKQETAKLDPKDAAKLQAAIKEAAAKLEAARQEAAKFDPKDAAKLEAAIKEAAAKLEASKQEANKLDPKDAAKPEADIKEAAAKLEAARQELAKLEAPNKQDAAKQDAPKQDAKQDAKLDAKEKEANLAAIKEEQEKLKDAFEKLQEELKDLEKKNEELKDKTDLETPEKEQQEVKDQQQQSSKNLAKKDMKKAAENQENASEKMQQMAEKMEQQQEESEQQENEVNAQALREILKNLLTSSFDQENLMQTIKGISPNDPKYVSLTQKQKDIKDNLVMIQDSLYSLSKKVPQIQSVVNNEIQAINQNIDMALQYLPERRTMEASSNQQYAMTSINNLALMLSDALNNMQMQMSQSKKSGQGKKPSLSQLAKMQQKLNENMQKAREQMQKQGQQPGQQPGQKPGQQGQKGQKGQGQNRQMSEEMARMAREQQMIRQQMQELNRDQNKDGKNTLGDLDKLARDMEQTETDLYNKKITQESIIRQQDIITKLLDAEKAERERETDPKRESKEGKDQTPTNKVVLEEFQKIKQRETELLKTVPPALNLFYQDKIRNYFKLLNPGN